MSLRTRDLAERLVALYNAGMAVVWLSLAGRAPHAKWLVLAHATAATLPWLYRACRRPTAVLRILHEIYPLVLLAGLWTELDVLNTTLGGPSSQIIPALDLALFGKHLHEVWLPALNDLWFSEPMYLMYFIYYPLLYVPLIVMLVRGRRAAARDITLRLMVTFLACYSLYVINPVNGPYLLVTPPAGPYQQGLFYRLTMMAHDSGSALGCAFPSSHVAGAITIAVVAWRWFPRWIAILLSVEATGVFFATTYTQNHYAVDSVAGLALGLGLQLIAVPALLRRRRAWQPVVALPVRPVTAEYPILGGRAA